MLESLLEEVDDVELTERNIDEDDGLLRDYLERIPVVELDGEVIGELVPDREGLRSSLLNTSAR